MNINDYILKEIKAFTLQDTVKSAQQLVKDLPITHFPIVENSKLLGCFTESDIQTIENVDHRLKEYAHLLTHFHAYKSTSLLDLITLFADNDSNLIPILNENQEYIGYYELCDILDAFADSPFLHSESETLVVEINKQDHSMSQISQIVESNNAKLLGMYISSDKNDSVQVTLKIISDEINEVIQTFRRYEYAVISTHKDDFYLEDLKNRADYLQQYLDM